MRLKYAIIACLLLVLSSGCRRRENNAADVQAVKDAIAAWDNAWNAGDCEMLASLYTPDAVAMPPNTPASIGINAMRLSCKKDFEQFKEENRTRMEDVRVSGNLAVARGTQEASTAPKRGGNSVRDKEKWIVVYQRQTDRSWKILWEIYNSDLPQMASTP
jgi:uncharacterized protein (TIGR02246 family)